MTHIRQQIREELKTLLVDNTTAGDKVFLNRLQNMQDAELPAILIYTKDETSKREGMNRPVRQRRTLEIAIELYINSSSLDDDIDSLSSEIEQILATNYNLNGKCLDIEYSGISISLANQGEKPIGIARMDYSITYRVNSNNPNLLIK